jgi:AcrR family transcriptional regulator
MTELVRERGVGGVTVAHIVGRSGVSRRTFYELFEDREGCMLAAFDRAIEHAAAVVLPAHQAAAGGWLDQTRVGLGALLEFLDCEPAMGGLCIVDALAGERSVLEHRARVLDALVDAVHRGAQEYRGSARRPARIVAEGVVGAVLAVLHARLTAPNPRPLAGLCNQLMGIVVLPYLGPAAAERELKRPTPRRRAPTQPRRDPLRDLDMRLTYRTVRVLLAIAELGGQGSNPSSRQVADASGIADQGQISKLLWRLEHLGLIANTTTGHSKGLPNAWTLTPKGQHIEQTIRTQTGR